ncbi:MAG: putative DNA-binding ribbon-helix-helix protein [Alphaproteobacteria bacterium]
MFSPPKKRSIAIDGHQTSFTLEDVFWELLQAYIQRHNVSLAFVIKSLDMQRTDHHKKEKLLKPIGLSCMIRQFITHDLIHSSKLS